MTNDLDTLLTALYVEIDDHVVPARQGRRDERARHGNLGGVRQWIESIFDTVS